MKSTYIFIAALLAFVASVVSADTYAWHAAEVRGGEEAVLVLCPGMNQDGAFFLKESAWMDFAEENDLGVIALNYRSNSDEMYSSARQGYYWPDQGSGAALLEAIGETYGKDLPIFIYGFSGGAQFTSRFVEWMPERVIAWSAYSAQFWDSPHDNDANPPGIVACGELDGARWQPSFSYFYEGRALGKPWVWVSLDDTGHVRHGAFEGFVRDFFERVQGRNELHVLADVETRVGVDSLEDSLQPELLAVFPSVDLLGLWRQVHTP
ncbi:MAG: pimeloyl-ACP methyl ester carboxylesterase [Bacteroidia bacterium]|jgi:pimeloyl-ACP methyl ester carboxylesterase